MLLACTTQAPDVPAPTPAAPPPPRQDDPVDWFRTQLGRMAESPELSCEAVAAAWSLQTRSANDPSLSARLADTPGFQREGDSVHLDWRELANATQSANEKVAFITLGGLQAALRRPCVDPTIVSHWLGRSPAFVKTSDCMQATLARITSQIVQPLPDRCICAVPAKDPLPRLRTALQEIGVEGQPLDGWPEQPGWKTPCPAE